MKFATAIVILCALLIHYCFSFAKMIEARSQKQKAAAVVVYSVGCPTFWRLLRKNKLESNSDRIFVSDFKNGVIFQL